jgi:transcriptional coactivator HFI1/ADA1
MLGEHRRARPVKELADAVPASAGGLSKTSKHLPMIIITYTNFMIDWDLEIRKRYAQPLAAESGEFPDTSTIESRMRPICYDTGLVSGHSVDAAQFMSVATETFTKQFLSSVFDKTRSNGPGSGGSAGSGGGANWVTTHKYRVQLEKEEELWLKGEIQRDKSGLLPVEAKAASERGPLGMADLRTALEVGDCGLGSMPLTIHRIMFDYREGELDGWDDYTILQENGRAVSADLDSEDIVMGGLSGTHINAVNGASAISIPNGINGHHEDDFGDTNDYGWEGSSLMERDSLNSLLDSCLAVGS